MFVLEILINTKGGCAYADVVVVQALQYHTHPTKDDSGVAAAYVAKSGK
jgi:hypothetical protein